MAKIRVLVIEDSVTVRKRIVEVIGSDPNLEVIGEAGDGRLGIELCQSLRPDVVTLDMMLPTMTGLAATEHIMAYCPTPILIVSASTNRGDLFKTYEALAAGALDVLDKPVGDEPDGEWERKLVSTIRLLARIKVITHPRARLAAINRRPASVTLTNSDRRARCIAIGASTGGPAALLDILCALPAEFPIPIVIVVHIGKLFAPAFAEWLDGRSPIRVAYARDGEPLPAVGVSRILLAPPDHHLVLRGSQLHLTSDPELHSCRPSIDMLFTSLARELGANCTACLLTGMGKDGAEGLLSLRRAGARTLVQDEASSVVFGMPREAILLGAAERVLSLTEFAPAMLSLAAAREVS